MFSSKKVVTWSFVFVLLLAVVTGCSSNKSTVEDAEAEVTIKSSNWEFDQQTYKVPAGKDVAIHHVNDEGHHGITIKGTNVKIQGDGSVVANLKPGEYEIICDIMCGTGHDEMIATLVVE
ncbi:cupredoxin domain-containing protein [Sutcliffiella halmapala]|uniref:cupredoxin domain-containing protein n=1 Tax=Sutcliffiella halmapala TaxID=79882 RepID=UPI000995385C|nr:cupredoxin domain-containing protein [Sutcliffiella halmapala]